MPHSIERRDARARLGGPASRVPDRVRPACAALAVLLLVAAGCATGRGGAGPACRQDLSPYQEPLVAVVDSVALQAAVEERWAPGTLLALARVGYDSLEQSPAVAVWAAPMAEPDRDALQGAVEGVISADRSHQPAEAHSFSLFLGNVAGPAVRRVAPLRVCPPSFVGQVALQEEIRREAETLGVAKTETVILKTRVRVDGTVSEIQVSRSTGNLDLDLAAGRVMRTARFRPAMVHGIPIAVWTRFPVTFEPGPGPGRAP